MPIRVECAPAFDYARCPHTTELVQDYSIPNTVQNKVIFKSPHLSLDLRFVPESSMDCVPLPKVEPHLLDLEKKGHLGPGACIHLELVEGQAVTFVLRTPPTRVSPQTRPDEQKAEALGVSLESESAE
jgi:hypothetical protein